MSFHHPLLRNQVLMSNNPDLAFFLSSSEQLSEQIKNVSVSLAIIPDPPPPTVRHGRQEGRQEAQPLTTDMQGGSHVHALLPVRTDKDDLKLLACFLDLPVGFHQDPCETPAGWTLKDNARTLLWDTLSPSPSCSPQQSRKLDPGRMQTAKPWK